MELREQHYVLALGKHHSIKKAAEALHVTPPTLSVFFKYPGTSTGHKTIRPAGKILCSHGRGSPLPGNSRKDGPIGGRIPGTLGRPGQRHNRKD